MATLKKNQKIYFHALIGTAVSILCFQTPVVLAQDNKSLALEEVIVTAQRREQSLQDVPVSVEVYSGIELRRQGWRDIDDLANFSPTVLLEVGPAVQELSIRGFGTTNPALTLDQASPTFIDGIHYGRTSQVKFAFMDVQSVEVLKGPQPVYFGQNATAGAINIRSRRPTDTLQGYIDVEVDSQNTQELTFGVGGPINDQWGYRVAGAYEDSGGYLKHLVTREPLGGYENIGGRASLQFRPSDRLQINGQVDFGRIRKDSTTALLCRTDGPVIYGRGGPLDNPNEGRGDGESVYVPPNIDPDNPDINTGGTAWGHPTTPIDQAPDCFSSKNAASSGGPYFELPQSVYVRAGETPGIDMRLVADAFLRTVPGGQGATRGFEDIDNMNSYIDLVYTFGNNTELQWLTGYNSYDRQYMRAQPNSPFLENASTRGEDYKQFSSELRITSAAGGRVEWTAGGFYQNTDLTVFSSNLRADVRQGMRYNDITEGVDFRSVFGSITFNFMGDKASLDIGGRYQDDKKFTTAEGYGASWVFDVCPEEPCDTGLTPSSVVFDPALDGYAGCEGRVRRGRDTYCLVDPATARFFGSTPSGPLYAMPYRESRYVPEPWWSGNAIPVGLTAPDYAVRADRGEGPYAESFAESRFSPQITLRFRPNNNTTLYAKYTEAAKIGGFDTGTNSIPGSLEEFTFQTEKARQIEVGIKGTLLDRRLRYDLDVFELEFPNLQVSITSPDPENRSGIGNAGQRVRGVEFSSNFAATENLTLGFAGAIMDGVMTSLPGAGCTPAEIAEAVLDSSAPCTFFDEDTGEVIPTPDNIIDAIDSFSIIDRTGSRAPRTPEWKFVLSANYVRPFATNYEFFANAKGYISDGYISASNSFDQIIKYNRHEDLSLLAGVRNVDRGWSVSVFARNLLEARPSYNPEFDIVPRGIESSENIGPSSFTSYGVKFEYLLGN